MPQGAPDYFRYLTRTPEFETWGLGVSAAGIATVAPGDAYPPGRHPVDRSFDWDHGRIIEAVQIVLIASGAGLFEMHGRDPVSVRAGTAFLILPRVWHRYRPQPKVGWQESWVELEGPVVDRMIAQQVLAAASPVRTGAFAAGLDLALDSVHALMRGVAPGFDAERSARALAVMSAWHRCGAAEMPAPHIIQAVAAAERHFAEHYAEPTNVQALAKRLGVGYSHFRRFFRQQTGFSPWQYVLRLRLARARRLLASSQATLDDIAGRLGFGSAFHFSAAFKKAFGVSPDVWRRRLRAEAGWSDLSPRRSDV